MSKSALELLREIHRKEHPNCPYGNEPHYVPPCFGDPGFYLCERLEDNTDD